MEIYTIGFTKKSARVFFELLKAATIRRLIDVRLNNVSQLAGFTKREDLAYLLDEVCNADYVHEPSLAPTADLLSAYREGSITWTAYEQGFLDLMEERQVADRLPHALFDRSVVLLCSEPTPERCHRRLVAEYLAKHWGGITVHHL